MLTRIVMAGVAAATLHTATLATEQSTPTAASPLSDDRIVCRKTLETGSLVKKKKQCFTLAEWDRIYAANREGNEKTRAQLSSGYNCSAGC